LPGAFETLEAIRDLQDPAGEAPALGLVSDFDFPPPVPPLPTIQHEYYKILDKLGIRTFFEPVAKHVTLSPEVGVNKPDPAIRAALDRLSPGLPFSDSMFVTEKKAHVLKARLLGMRAVHFKGPGEVTGDIEKLTDLIPRVQAFLDGLA
jgi:hypothetical protein